MSSPSSLADGGGSGDADGDCVGAAVEGLVGSGDSDAGTVGGDASADCPALGLGLGLGASDELAQPAMRTRQRSDDGSVRSIRVSNSTPLTQSIRLCDASESGGRRRMPRISMAKLRVVSLIARIPRGRPVPVGDIAEDSLAEDHERL